MPSDPVGSDGTVSLYAPFLRIGVSEAMDPSTIDPTNLRVANSTGEEIAVSVRWNGTANEAELAAQQRWADGIYTATIDSAALDDAGNPLESEYVWRFRVDTGASRCAGDCDGSCEVTVDELIVGVNIALRTVSAAQCLAMDSSGEGQVTVDELIAAVNMALLVCPSEY